MPHPVILWLRQDLRLHDQPALIAAAQAGAVIPVYVGAQRWWLHHSLAALADSLAAKGSRLILRRGRSAEVLASLLQETGASQVHALRHYEPWWREAEAALGEALVLHDGHYLARLEEIRTGAGQPFRIYGSFWKALAAHLPPPPPEPVPETIAAPDAWPRPDALESWALLPTKPDWSAGFDTDWKPGEDTALAKAHGFSDRVDAYAEDRNIPAKEGSSRLSPHLHFGEISPRQVWHALGDHGAADKFHKELAWRDFTDGVILALPRYADQEGRERYARFPWRRGKAAEADLAAWQQGRTGYPIVDAGMRQMWATGWMHNRVRMITASFLVKHLLIDWREGERWFWDCLVDADYGNNAVNWQWIAGTGIDANMFTRIMAPLTQSEKFDAGDYIRRWVPELAGVPDPAIHDPDAHGARPAAYPAKIIGHREARERALAANRRLVGAGAPAEAEA
jgi:deoxyribodipyrimidine photo-lyase